MSTNTLKMWIVAGGLVFVIALVLGLLQWQVDGSIRYDAADTALACVHGDQCERPGSGKLLAEFQNTLSNLAYLFFGVCVIVRAGREGLPMNARPGMLLFGASLCFLAVCSAYYHGTLNFEDTRTAAGAVRGMLNDKGALVCAPPARTATSPQLLDIVGVYATLIALFLYGLEGLFKKGLRKANVWTWIFGLGFPALTAIGFPFVAGDHARGGAAAGLLLLLLLGYAAMFMLMRQAVSGKFQAVGLWGIWLIGSCALGVVSTIIKPDLRWDSTGVFGAMMLMLTATLGTNWSVSPNRLPWPEFTILAIVFGLGIVPRLLDGYESDPFFLKDLCSPDGFLQAHATWHVMSAIALVLSYDLLEKSRADDAGAAGRVATVATVLLPQGDDLSASMRRPLGEQPVSAIVWKIVLSTASALMLIVVVGNREHGWIGVVGTVAACLLCALLWLWPVFWKPSSAPRGR